MHPNEESKHSKITLKGIILALVLSVSKSNPKEDLGIGLKTQVTAFQYKVLALVSQRKSNKYIAEKFECSVKIIENAVNRAAQNLNINPDQDLNVRVQLVLLFKTHLEATKNNK
jgi:DNA-binding NarL/FixJ family response regulator